MIENAFFLVTEDIARRANVIDVAYMTADGRFVLDLMDFKRLRLQPEEYLTGVQGVERVDEMTASRLVIENGRKRYSDVVKEEEESPVLNEEPIQEETIAENPVEEEPDAEEPVEEEPVASEDTTDEEESNNTDELTEEETPEPLPEEEEEE